MKLFSVVITALLLPTLAFTQPNNDPSSKFIGKWLLVKHLYTEKGKTEDFLSANEVYTYDFARNGTYVLTLINKKNESTTIYNGKWKVITAGKKLRLYDNSLPSDPKQLVNDNNLPIIKLTAGEFVTRELLFGMDLWGISHYKKQ